MRTDTDRVIAISQIKDYTCLSHREAFEYYEKGMMIDQIIHELVKQGRRNHHINAEEKYGLDGQFIKFFPIVTSVLNPIKILIRGDVIISKNGTKLYYTGSNLFVLYAADRGNYILGSRLLETFTLS